MFFSVDDSLIISGATSLATGPGGSAIQRLPARPGAGLPAVGAAVAA